MRAIAAFKRKHGYNPSYREIGEALGISPPSVWSHINLLEKKGLIMRNAHKQRAIVLVEEVNR